MGKPLKVAPVLEGDTALKFPHALLISASAGSGKTYTLTRRYVQFLLSDKVPGNDLSGILAVTFTNNAAKEMKARILAWLKALALDKDCEKMDETLELVSLGREDVQRRARELVERIITNYSDFHIQTIDSFLARVMSASADELKLPLKAEITMTYDVLMDLALYSLFSKIGKEDFPAKTVDDFLAVLPKTDAYPWNPILRVKENFNSFLSREGGTAGLLAAGGGGHEAGVRAKFSATLEFCGSLVKHYGGSALFKAKVLSAMEARNLTGFLAAYKFDYAIFNGTKKKNLLPGWEKDRDSLNEMVRELTELNAMAYYQPYVGLYSRFKAELERVKRGKSDVIHINDIAKKLSSYINEKNVPEIYLKLGERISHFLVDEFQDTNRLQWDVLRPLAEEAISKNGSLFVVGDIKQAIYMFRNADYRIMRSLLDIAEGREPQAEYISLEPLDGKLRYVNLPVNYRSDGEVLAYVDALFKEKLKGVPALAGQDITGLTTYEQAVQPQCSKDGYVKTDVLELEDLDEPGPQKEWLLRAVRGARERYPLNEIAILVGKNRRIEPVVEWLTGAGIPVASLSSLDIRKRKVVAELIAYLKFLETPSDDLSFAAFITGDIFTVLTGLPREEMMEFVFRGRALARRAAGGNRLLYAQFRNHAKYGRYWEKHLDAPFGKVGYLPLYELVSLIYREFRLFAGFPGEAAFLSRFMDAVMTLETQGVTSSRSFIEYASGVDEDKAAVFSIALPEYIDAVRVMTFHKSKGLGFSVVINLIYEERGQPDPMYFEEKNGEIRVYHITKAAAEASARLGPVYEGRRSDSHVQELNTLYVISTRARHELYNLVLRKARKSEAREPKLSDLFETFEAGRRAQRVPVARKASSPVDIASAEARAAQRFDALRPTCNSFFEKAEGELVHAMLARLIELPADPAPALAAGFEELRYNYPFMFDKAKLLPGLLSFLTGHAARPLFAAVPGRLVLNEAEFIDKAGALFRVDRVIIDADAVTAVDFKTGGEDVEKHSAQLLNYLGILREVYSRPARGVLAYVDLQKMVEVPAVRPQKEKNL